MIRKPHVQFKFAAKPSQCKEPFELTLQVPDAGDDSANLKSAIRKLFAVCEEEVPFKVLA